MTRRTLVGILAASVLALLLGQRATAGATCESLVALTIPDVVVELERARRRRA